MHINTDILKVIFYIYRSNYYKKHLGNYACNRVISSSMKKINTMIF